MIKRLKPWMRLSIMLVVAIGAFAVGIGSLTHARAASGPPFVQAACQVYFLDGPKQGTTEPDTFYIYDGGSLASVSADYVGEGLGSWWYTDSSDTTIDYTFTAPLAFPPSATLTATGTVPVSTTTVSWTGVGTVTDSSGNVLGMTHGVATCPYFYSFDTAS